MNGPHDKVCMNCPFKGNTKFNNDSHFTKKGLDAYCVRFQANKLKGEKLVQSVLCISRLVQQTV